MLGIPAAVFRSGNFWGRGVCQSPHVDKFQMFGVRDPRGSFRKHLWITGSLRTNFTKKKAFSLTGNSYFCCQNLAGTCVILSFCWKSSTWNLENFSKHRKKLEKLTPWAPTFFWVNWIIPLHQPTSFPSLFFQGIFGFTNRSSQSSSSL